MALTHLLVCFAACGLVTDVALAMQGSVLPGAELVGQSFFLLDLEKNGRCGAKRIV